ncbi:glycosyltransferase family 2 protein [Vibrio aestuarianus subsp. cardii]|uniref:glycosyltransferase n=1 Tax=Vibrio aestuarianus TaxID=28171 RepID=UPI00159344D7|nr:glycosyltransferase [Vibrio aestuarianus]MDE1309887.1 glycosyltransferase [Vibrio aestuarianus]NGZ18930.1 glycosyltransferase family 2 protein [Vibrio aestuarianus]NGZ93963.1 glycosyltransferase family 2 protein [Vibrio aestuarianus subsp. cardii]
MAQIYISIVSHGNDEDIINNFNLQKINSLESVKVIIRDNVSSDRLKKYCEDECFIYNCSDSILGFGANNNINFEVATKMGMKKTDWFVLFNPDLDISATMIKKLSNTIDNSSNQLFAINLFFDEKFSTMEQSLRKFPTFISFFNIIKGKSFTEAYNKFSLADGSIVDWAAGSFLVFQAELYQKLNGFDETYFMYFEDVDICFRARKYYDQNVVYLSNIKAIHQGGYKNRKVFSKHFRWYFSSLLRFLFKSTFGFKK